MCCEGCFCGLFLITRLCQISNPVPWLAWYYGCAYICHEVTAEIAIDCILMVQANCILIQSKQFTAQMVSGSDKGTAARPAMIPALNQKVPRKI